MSSLFHTPETPLTSLQQLRSLRKAKCHLSWEAAFTHTRGAQCEEPHDKIFGLLGLVDDRLRIQPDYNQPLSSVLLEVVKKDHSREVGTVASEPLLNVGMVCEELGLDWLLILYASRKYRKVCC